MFGLMTSLIFFHVFLGLFIHYIINLFNYITYHKTISHIIRLSHIFSALLTCHVYPTKDLKLLIFAASSLILSNQKSLHSDRTRQRLDHADDVNLLNANIVIFEHAVTNQNCIHEDINSRLNCGNTFYRSVQSLYLTVHYLKSQVVGWIHLAQDGAQWRTVVNTVMNNRVP
jgi:hypothetical protein